MRTPYRHQIILLARRLLLCYALYTTARLTFYALNRHSFPGDAGQLMSDLFYGLWFDSFSVFATNSVFIVLSVLPSPMFYRNWYQVMLAALFFVVNISCLALNFIDAAYFPYIRKRSTGDLLDQLGGQSDVLNLIPAFFADHWLLVFWFLIVASVLVWIYRSMRLPPADQLRQSPGRTEVVCWMVGTLGLSFLAIRGTLAPAPLDIVNAGAVTTPGRAALVLNTPFSVIKSTDAKPLPGHSYFTKRDLDSLWNTTHHFDSLTFSRENVVVILLESFSKEYTALGNKRSFTPFFDSLMGHSLVYTNAYANAVKSIEGIPAVLSSIPALMDNPYINSVYANNRQTSVATLLRDEGYKTAFFHGGSNGTMNFTQWSAQAGYADYFGRNEYGDDEDYDGYWGIWDEPFLQFAARKIENMKEPFHAAVFTLSSHHPYRVPDQYLRQFPRGENDFEGALRYADHSLRKFFETASLMSWYRKTLFVLVADHAILSDTLFRRDALANFRIPVAFFRPDNSLQAVRGDVFGQIDILPQTMALLGYNKPFFSLGKHPHKKEHHITAYYADGYYYTFTDSMLFTFSGDRCHSIYNYRRDSVLVHRLDGQNPSLEQRVNNSFRSLLQRYGQSMTQDAMGRPGE